jgi:Domain of unknown function (DUF4166)
LLYLVMRGTRGLLVCAKGMPKIQILSHGSDKSPIFQPVFGAAWSAMPQVLRQRYANRAFTQDVVKAEGFLDITASPLMRILSPLLKITGLLVPYEGKHVPVTVHFRSEPHSAAFCLDREFRFPGRPAYVFQSAMIATGGNEIVERLRFGICWKATCTYDGNKVKLVHKGYVWRVFGLQIPVPVQLLFGKGSAEEEATGPSSFRMSMDIIHPLFGHVFGYRGSFAVKAVTLDP